MPILSILDDLSSSSYKYCVELCSAQKKKMNERAEKKQTWSKKKSNVLDFFGLVHVCGSGYLASLCCFFCALRISQKRLKGDIDATPPDQISRSKRNRMNHLRALFGAIKEPNTYHNITQFIKVFQSETNL